MSTTITAGWLNDKNGDKFAPKTLVSQVQTNDGTLLEDLLGDFIIRARKTASGDSIDKTMEEIKEAYNAGRAIYCDYSSVNAGGFVNRLSLTARNSDTSWAFMGLITETTVATVVLNNTSIAETYTNLGTINQISVDGKSLTNTAGSVAIPKASILQYGVVKLSAATNSSSATLGATASAVKSVYDLANSKLDASLKGAASGVAELDSTGKIPTTQIPSEYITETELTNKNYITKAVSDLTNYYTKSNTYTKTEVNELVSANDNFFIAEYGVTTFEEIVEAANTDKKTVLCRINDVGTIFTLAYCHADGARFIGYTAYGEQEACCEPNNEWTISNIGIQADWNQNDETALDYIKNRPTSLKNPNALTFTGAVTGTYDGSSAKTVNIPVAPTKTSQLTNDSGFLTSIPTEYVTETELTNKNYITKAVSDLTNYYTKTQVDNKISQIPKFDIEVVTSLPTSNISDTTVYLVNSGIAGDDLYTEYIYVNNAWEVLGVQRVDLTNYATKDEIPTALKNPNALTIGNIVYDGSEAQTVTLIGKPGTGTAAEMFNAAREASGECSHAEGMLTKATGNIAHAEGVQTTASGVASHAEGHGSVASGDYSHAEGNMTQAAGKFAHSEGEDTYANGDSSHTEGNNTIANSKAQHAQGEYNIIDTEGAADTRGTYAHIVGNGTEDNARSNAHTLDWDGNAWFAGDVYVGSTSGTNKDTGSKKLATEEYVDAKVQQPDWNQNDETALDYVKNRTHYAEGSGEILFDGTFTQTKTNRPVTIALPEHLEVGENYIVIYDGVTYNCVAWRDSDSYIGIGARWDFDTEEYVYTDFPFVITILETDAPDGYDVSVTVLNVEHTILIKEGVIYQLDEQYLPSTIARSSDIVGRPGTGDKSAMFNAASEASGLLSFAQGFITQATGMASHAEGYGSKAQGTAAHAEGSGTVAGGDSAHAEGLDTTALGAYSHVQGKYNIEDADGIYTHIVGNGTSDTARSNAHTLDWDGNAWFQGDVYIGSTSGTNKDAGSKKLATEDKVNEKGIHYIVGNSTTAGVWTGACDNITEYFDGLTIAYKVNIAGISGGTTLNINNLGAIAVKRNASTAVTTIYPVGSVILLTYSAGSWLTADYDANTKNTAGTSNKADTKLYLVGGASQSSSGVTTYSNANVYIGTDNCLYSNGVKVATADDIAGANNILIAEYGSTAYTTMFEAAQEQGKAVFCFMGDASILPMAYAHLDRIVFIGYSGNGVIKEVTCTDASAWSQTNYVLSIENGGTGCTSITDTTYTTARYRASSLHNSTTTPTVNGVIAWQYA